MVGSRENETVDNDRSVLVILIKIEVYPLISWTCLEECSYTIKEL